MTVGERSDWRWRTYPLAIIASVLAAVLIITITADERDSLPSQVGRDFPVFYSSGELVWIGDGHLLYDLDTQIEVQAWLWQDEGKFILYAYPPVLAGVYAPISTLDYRVAYLIHTAAMVGALVLSVRLLSSLVPLLGEPRHRLAAVAFALAYFPMLVGTFIGQNTPLVVLGLSAVWWGLAHQRDTLAGVAAGLLLLKPQYGVPVLGLVFLARYWHALIAALVSAVALAVVSIAVSGIGWFGAWWGLVSSLSTVDMGGNVAKEVSILGIAESVLGAGSTAARVVWVIALVGIVPAVVWRLRGHVRLDPISLSLVPPMLLLIAPHALYYDSGMLLVSVAALLPTLPARWRPPVLALFVVGGLAYLAPVSIGVQPVALLGLGTFAWAWWASAADRGPVEAHHLLVADS
jgi:hypothetical protein